MKRILLVAAAVLAAAFVFVLSLLPPRRLIPGSEYEADVERASRLDGIAADLGLESVLELGLRFCLAAPGVSVALVGLSSLEHLQAAIRWSERGPLPHDDLERLLEMAAAR